MIDLTQLKVGEALGAGSQGKVFLASDERGVRYTVKLVMLAENADRQAVFERAGRFREDLLDRSMVPILSYGMVLATPVELARQLGKLSRDALVVVMPHVAGVSLAEVMAAAPLTLRETAVVLLGIASALAKLPEGVVHGDLRPPNVFLRPNGEVLLMDPDLTQEPPDGEDMRALGGMSLVLLNAALLPSQAPRQAPAPSDETDRAIAYLRTLAANIAGQGMPHGPQMEAHEAQHQLGIIAELLGVSLEHPETFLAKRVKGLEGAAAKSPANRRPAGIDSGLEPTWFEEHRGIPRVLIGLGVAAAVAGIAFALSNMRPHSKGPPRPAVDADGDGADGLYDHSGKVHYREQVHVLGPGEFAAQSDGVFQAVFEFPVPRLALLSNRREVLWEIRYPDAGGMALLDVKPGRYFVEQDREVDHGGLQHDVRPVAIDRRNPLRIATTSEMMAAPRPQLDGGATPPTPQ